MKICENGIVREMTAEEIAAIKNQPVYAAVFSEQEATAEALKLLIQGKAPTTDDERIKCGALYPAWSAGNHKIGEIYTTPEQVWECYQAYDNAVYPDIKPDNAAWYTFNRPLHGKTAETARDFVHPTGAHDVYRAGEYAIYNQHLYKCKSDTAYSPDEYAAAWEQI